jgi:hypothetical protein
MKPPHVRAKENDMSYAPATTPKTSYDAAVECMRQALADNGFGARVEIGMQAAASDE